MMAAKRRNRSGPFKAKVAIAALGKSKFQTINQIAKEHGVHPQQVTVWKKQAQDGLKELFDDRPRRKKEDAEKLVEQLYGQIGRLKMELEWLKKKLNLTIEQKRDLVDLSGSSISVSRQCVLLGLPRSTFYHQPHGESPENLALMRIIDELYTRRPFYGYRKMTEALHRRGHEVNQKRVRRLMQIMDISAIYPKKRLSIPGQGHCIYRYLLKGVKVERPNQVWSTDITYIPMSVGHVYLMAVLDWYSRYVVSWTLSNTMAVEFCLKGLEKALKQGRPEIFNSDQGSQFTSEAFTGRLESAQIQISMDGRGRVFDNIFIERLWRTVKQEEVYLRDWAEIEDARKGLAQYFRFYNRERFHQALKYQTPAEVFFGKENRG